jgi:hypothetical protein
LKYAYCLKFEERPRYEYLRFLLKKILMERNLVHTLKFDWSLKSGEQFRPTDENDKHSSISSCDISDSEQVDDDCLEDMRKNIMKHSSDYNSKVKTAKELFESAIPGSGEKYFKIPDNFIKIGEYQYLPMGADQSEQSNERNDLERQRDVLL